MLPLCSFSMPRPTSLKGFRVEAGLNWFGSGGSRIDRFLIFALPGSPPSFEGDIVESWPLARSTRERGTWVLACLFLIVSVLPYNSKCFGDTPAVSFSKIASASSELISRTESLSLISPNSVSPRLRPMVAGHASYTRSNLVL